MKRLAQYDAATLSLAAVFLLLPLAHIKLSFFGFPLYLPEIAVLFAFFIHLFGPGKAFSREKFPFPDTFAAIGLGLFALGALLSFLMNPFSLTGLGLLKSWFFFPLLASWLVFSEARDEEKRELFLFSFLLSLSAAAFGSLVFLSLGVLTYDGRLFGLYASPNFLAVFIAPLVLLALSFLCSEKWNVQKNALRNMLLFSVILLVLMTLFSTRSYGVWSALFLSVMFFLGGLFVVQGGSKKRILLSVVFVMLCLAGFIFLERDSPKWESLLSFDERSSLSSRLMIWRAGTEILSDNVMFGIAPGRFQVKYLEYQQYFPPYLEWAVPEPHNLYLAVFLSTGLIGFLGFLLFVGRAIFLLGRVIFSEVYAETVRLTSVLSLALLFFFLLYGITDTPYFKNDLAYAFLLPLCIGLAGLGKTKAPLES